MSRRRLHCLKLTTQGALLHRASTLKITLKMSIPAFTSLDFLGVGSPRFEDHGSVRQADQQGLRAAWAARFDHGDIKEAIVGVGGDFAVGLRQASGRTILAVDRFATGTLCYRIDGDRLLFAENADALAGPGAKIDPQAIFDYLYFHVVPSPRTIFTDVFRLPAGHFAIFEGGTLTVTPYWVPRFQPLDKAVPFEVLRDEFRGLLKSAVARQLSNGKPACFLSGGTDSSTVAGIIGEVAGTPAATYSIGFGAAGYDEMSYARLAARHFGTDHHEYYVTPEDLVRNMPEVAAHYDQPFGNSSALPALCCARMARDDGVTRILAGDGGDELFGGNSRYAKQRLFDAYQRVPGALRRGLLEPLFSTRAMRSMPLLRKGSSYIEQATQPMPDRYRAYNLLVRLGIEEVLTPSFLAQVDVHRPLQHQRLVWAAAETEHALNRELAWDWRFTLAENDLRKVCGTAQLAGIEVGFPLLDDDLLAFSMRLQPRDKLRGMQLRWFFKEALRGFLPNEIISKKKQGFGLPFGVWAHQHEGLRGLARDGLLGIAARGIVKPDFVRSLLDERLAQHPGYYGEMVWILTMLELWMREHAPDYRVNA